jgi:TfoX/Sxy family transcriptional regulator of competence genes
VAEPYFERLSVIAGRLPSKDGLTLEPKHFFSGAALFANGKICATLGPFGFGLKAPAALRQRLVETGEGRAFRFFPKGPVKREYVSLSDSIIQDEGRLQSLIATSANYVLGLDQ